MNDINILTSFDIIVLSFSFIRNIYLIVALLNNIMYAGVQFENNDGDEEGSISIVGSAWLTPKKRRNILVKH